MARQTFTVGKAPLEDIGKGRVRIHYTKRGGARRFAVFNIAVGRQSFLASVLGHEGDSDRILLDLDQRNDLGVRENDKLEAELTLVGFPGRVRWYLSSPDPAVHVPAWLAFWSVILGGLGFALGIVSIVCG